MKGDCNSKRARVCAQANARRRGTWTGAKSVSETHRDRVGVLEPVHPRVPLGRHLAAVPLCARLVNDEAVADCAQKQGPCLLWKHARKRRKREIEPSRSENTSLGIACQLIGRTKKQQVKIDRKIIYARKSHETSFKSTNKWGTVNDGRGLIVR